MNPIARVTVLTLAVSALWLLRRKAQPGATPAAPAGRRAVRSGSPWWNKRPYPGLDTSHWQPHSCQAYLRPVTSW